MPYKLKKQEEESMACHEEILEAAKAIIKSKGINEFTPIEVIHYLNKLNNTCKESTIRTHIVSRCFKDTAEHHAKRYEYFERIDYGLYKVIC